MSVALAVGLHNRRIGAGVEPWSVAPLYTRSK